MRKKKKKRLRFLLSLSRRMHSDKKACDVDLDTMR